ncbi:hypothetical protein HQ531_12410 [bacterium]|nr:hypothetical protein [bacterium]
MQRHILIGLTFFLISNGRVHSEIPASFQSLNQLTSYSDFTQIVQELDSDPRFTLSEAGKSSQGRSLWLLRIAHPNQKINWRVFFYAQQHGNEPAGKEALIYLAKSIQQDPKILPRGVELWLMPMVNPDGSEQDQRKNAVDADLNRDHMILEQLETQALHRAFRSIQPHLSIDCHEFGRDSDDYREQGWLEWPEIMMDYANYPLLNDEVVSYGAGLVQRMESPMIKKGINFHRYFVGGVPPDGEQRFSAPDMDGGLNGAGIYGGFSFIIEVGVYRKDNDDNHDLPRRVYVYTELLQQVLQDRKIRMQGLALFGRKIKPELPIWAPTNYFWAKLSESAMSIPVIDSATAKAISIPAPNFMPDLVIKKSVSVPLAYLINAEQADVFTDLLNRHEIPFQVIETPRDLLIQRCLLDTVEMDFDDVYHRYGGRVIATLNPKEKVLVEPGSLIVPVEAQNGIRVLALLEPTQMFGLYQYPTYLKMVTDDRILPVARILREK